MIKIEDQRTSSSWFPAQEVLERVLTHLDAAVSNGIRSIVLLDSDYHGSRTALARYVPISGSNRADIEIYCDRLSEFPEALKLNRIATGMYVLSILCHELYHHRVRFHKSADQPVFDMEQRRADNWGVRQSLKLIGKIYPREDHVDEYNELLAYWKENG